nr:flagellar basal body protein [uncultured Caldimonas sp.]
MSATAIALSGMNASMLRMDTAAHNIANAQTQGFRRQAVAQEAQPAGGVAAQVVQQPTAGTSLAQDLVEQKAASYMFKANVLTLRTERDMLGSLLDLHA